MAKGQKKKYIKSDTAGPVNLFVGPRKRFLLGSKTRNHFLFISGFPAPTIST